MRERVVTESSQMSFYLWAGCVSPAGPGVLLSCVYIMAPLACIVTTVTSGEDILELSVIIPLHHYAAASVWGEVNETYLLNGSENRMRATL